MIRQRALVLALALSPLVAGCPPGIIPHRAQSSIERSYTLGTTQTASAGSPMMSIRSMTDAPLYEVAVDYTPPQHDPFRGGLDYPALTKGMRFVQVATRTDGAIGLMRSGYGVTRAPSLGRETYMPVTVWVDSNGVVSSTMEGREWERETLFLPVRGVSGATEAARVELVYDGVDGTMINLTRNEYYGGPSAPTSSRPLRLTPSTSKTIAHDGVTIEVVEATPSSITFRVVNDSEMRWVEE